MLAAPLAGAGDTLLSQVLSMAVKRGLVKPKQHVVCVLSVRGDLVLNVCQVDDGGSGLQSNLASLGAPRQYPFHCSLCTRWPGLLQCCLCTRAQQQACLCLACTLAGMC